MNAARNMHAAVIPLLAAERFFEAALPPLVSERLFDAFLPLAFEFFGMIGSCETQFASASSAVATESGRHATRFPGS